MRRSYRCAALQPRACRGLPCARWFMRALLRVLLAQLRIAMAPERLCGAHFSSPERPLRGAP
eukprot:846641-Alexandrium_andersonii.AAC.1